MTTVRGWLTLVLVALVPHLAFADVDLSGRWLVHATISSIGYELSQCQVLVQSGTTLTSMTCDAPPTTNSVGTIDPVTGAFDLPGYFSGVAAADSNTFTASGSLTICHFIPQTCDTLPVAYDGARCGVAVQDPICGGDHCGDGVHDPGEECDDGLASNGTAASCCTLDCRAKPEGTSCDLDANPATADTCSNSGICLAPLVCGGCTIPDAGTHSCVADVRNDCRRPVLPAGRVALSAQTVAWTWDHGAATTLAEFGDPLSATDYNLCVFADDGQGGTLVVASRAVSHGGTCRGRPCWRQNGAGTTYRYGNSAADGFRALTLKSGVAGAAKVTLKAKGASLGMPPSLDVVHAPVTVQLERLDDGSCWASGFPTASASSVSQFRARNGQ